MAVIILPGAQDDLFALQDYTLSRWSEALWIKAEDEIFDKLDKADRGMLKGTVINELLQHGHVGYKKILTSHHHIVFRKMDADTYVYLIAGQRQDFKNLLFQRLMSNS